jgi:hypothetical protein
VITDLVVSGSQRERTSEVPRQLCAPVAWARRAGVRSHVVLTSGYSDITYARCSQFTEALAVSSSDTTCVLSVDSDVRFTEDSVGRLVEELLSAPASVGAVTVPCSIDAEATRCDVCCVVDGQTQFLLCGLGAILFRASALMALSRVVPIAAPHGSTPVKAFTASGVLRLPSGFSYVGEDYRLLARLRTLGYNVGMMFDEEVTHKDVVFCREGIELSAYDRPGYLDAVSREMRY